jgi:pseudaminic acid cytidylyltransferase
MNRIAIIPARGGSKRIPRKNIRTFGGKAMISYAIDAARDSGLFDHVIVSTDDNEIAAISRELGAQTPFVRPPELSDDHTPTVPVIAHAIQACETIGIAVDVACCIYPCVPFIQVDDLKSSLDLFVKTGTEYCFPITEFPSAIQRALRRNMTGTMSPFQPEFELTRTQDLELAFYDVGQFYWGKRDAWFSNPNVHRNSIGFQIPSWRVIDIDTQNDWKLAEKMYQCLYQYCEDIN